LGTARSGPLTRVESNCQWKHSKVPEWATAAEILWGPGAPGDLLDWAWLGLFVCRVPNVVPRQPCQRPLHYPYVSSSPHEPTSEAQERCPQLPGQPITSVRSDEQQEVSGRCPFPRRAYGPRAPAVRSNVEFGRTNFHGMQPGRCGNGGLSQAAGQAGHPAYSTISPALENLFCGSPPINGRGCP
jgi:hypothetical protein